MTNVSGLSEQSLQPIQQTLLNVPKLDNWIELNVTDQVVISGVISRHPDYPTGMRILTSTIEGFTSDMEGHVFVETQNSKYELGERIEIRGQEYMFNAIASVHAITVDQKQTIC